MNQLSWLIYWADVAPSLSQAVFTTLILLLIAYLGTTYIFNLLSNDAEHPCDLDPKADHYRRINLFLVVPMIVTLVSTSLIPSNRETYYAIAASEVGEEIVKSETAGKAMQALNNWLDDQMESENDSEQ